MEIKPPSPNELQFPVNKEGDFITQEEKQQIEDEKMIQQLSDETKAMPHLIKKDSNGKWTVNGIPVEDYKLLYEGNDNSDLFKND